MEMKRRIITAAVLVALLAGTFALWQTRPVSVDRSLTAYIYRDGEATGETVITISGKTKKSLWSSEQTYVGSFAIDCLEKSCRDNVQAKLTWYEGICIMGWSLAGDFYTAEDFLGIDEISADPQMSEITISFSDGTVISTSEPTSTISMNSGV